MTSQQATRVRLRDRLSSLECLDLSTQSSTLLSPFSSLHGGQGLACDAENAFPFRISPINSMTALGRQQLGIQLHRPSSPRQQHNPLASIANIPPAALSLPSQPHATIKSAAVKPSELQDTTVSDICKAAPVFAEADSLDSTTCIHSHTIAHWHLLA